MNTAEPSAFEQYIFGMKRLLKRRVPRLLCEAAVDELIAELGPEENNHILLLAKAPVFVHSVPLLLCPL